MSLLSSPLQPSTCQTTNDTHSDEQATQHDTQGGMHTTHDDTQGDMHTTHDDTQSEAYTTHGEVNATQANIGTTHDDTKTIDVEAPAADNSPAVAEQTELMDINVAPVNSTDQVRIVLHTMCKCGYLLKLCEVLFQALKC